MTFLGIVIPSLAIVAAVRRWITPVAWLSASGFLILTLLFLHGAVVTGKLPLPADEVARGYPWRGLFGDVNPRNPLTNDTVRLFLPWMQVARDDFLHLRAPLWNPYSFSGYPLLGNGESAPFSPLFLVTLFVSLPKQIVAMGGIKIFVSLFFTYLFCRRERLSHEASVFAAIAFAFCTFETVFLYYSTVSVSAFLPMVMFAFVNLLDQPSRRSIAFAAVAVATIVANGHPESVLHVAIGLIVWLAIEFAASHERREWLRRFALAVVAAIAGIAISAPAWIPVVEQVLRSVRLAEMSGGGWAGYPFTAIWALVSPNGFGNPVRHNWSWISNYSSIASSYVGLLPLALIGCAALSRQTSARDRALIAGVAAMFLVAMQWTIVGRWLNGVFPLSITANDKLRFVCVFVVAVVAARALELPRASIAMSAIVVASFALYADWKQMRLLRPLDLGAPFLLLAFPFLPKRLRRWAASVVLSADLFALNAGFNALVDAKYFAPRLPIIEALRRVAPNEPFRVVGIDWVLLPNASALYRLEDIRGSDPMAFADYDRLLQRFTVQEEGTWVRRIVDSARPELDELNVVFALAEPDAELSAKWRLQYRGRDGSLWRNEAARRRFFSDEARIESIREESPGRFRLEVSSERAATIRSSQPAPGWRVVVNERRVESTGFFIRFEVPPGSSVVTIEYRPLSYRLSWLVALSGILFLAWNSRGGRGVVGGPERSLAARP